MIGVLRTCPGWARSYIRGRIFGDERMALFGLRPESSPFPLIHALLGPPTATPGATEHAMCQLGRYETRGISRRVLPGVRKSVVCPAAAYAPRTACSGRGKAAEPRAQPKHRCWRALRTHHSGRSSRGRRARGGEVQANLFAHRDGQALRGGRTAARACGVVVGAGTDLGRVHFRHREHRRGARRGAQQRRTRRRLEDLLRSRAQMVHQGQVLVELDTNVERAQLTRPRRKRDLAQINANRARGRWCEKAALAQSPSSDTDDAQLKTSASSTDMNALQAQIARKVVRAPFTRGTPRHPRRSTLGRVPELGDAAHGAGSDRLGVRRLHGAAAPAPRRHEGGDAGARDDRGGGRSPARDSVTGRAIDPEIDSSTRSIKIRASVPNKEEKLRPGMFADGLGPPPARRRRAWPIPSDRDRARRLRRLGLRDRGQEGSKPARRRTPRPPWWPFSSS